MLKTSLMLFNSLVSKAIAMGAWKQELPGRIWEGKESILEAIAAICKAAPAQIAASGASQTSSEAVLAALTGAIKRPKRSFRLAALSALEPVLESLEGDFFGEIGNLLYELVKNAVDRSALKVRFDESLIACYSIQKHISEVHA